MASQLQLKVFLIKKGFSAFDDVLSPKAKATDYALKPSLRWDGRFRVRDIFPKTPDWATKVAPLLHNSLPTIKTSSSGSVLLLRIRDRILAFTWGYGRSLLRSDCFERDFGLRVVLNTIDHESLRSMDMQTIEEVTVSTRRQTSRASDFGAFGLDSSQDLLRGVTGIPREPTFASRIAGAEALTIGVEMDIIDLPGKCEELLTAYTSVHYKTRFGFIDFLRIERDPSIVAQLDAALGNDLASGTTSRMHLAPAEPEDWENISGFTYSQSSRTKVYPDLDVDEALHEMNPRKGFSLTYLRGKSIGVRYRESEVSVDKYSFYSCLVYETELDGKLYVLSGGDWHQVHKTWADGVRSRVKEIPGASVTLPPSKAGEREEDYNARVAAANNWALMDRRIISLDPPHDRVEMCDLLTPTGQLMHVKRKTVSATLSHLFSQGRVSADLLFRSSEFREGCRRQATIGNPEWAAMVPLDRPDPAQYEIVYVVLARTHPDWPSSLPFFSQLNLDNTATRLRQLGYRVSLQHVPADP